ncbi:hypothetical protein Hanom_Chr11g01036971 [Helianthus anomalus]
MDHYDKTKCKNTRKQFQRPNCRCTIDNKHDQIVSNDERTIKEDDSESITFKL